MQLTKEKLHHLEDIAYQIRRLSVEMITYARWGHIGGSLSMADLLAVLYFHTMQVDPAQPRWEGVRGGLIHVPWLPEQGQPSMRVDEIVRGLEVALTCALSTQQDIRKEAGALN